MELICRRCESSESSGYVGACFCHEIENPRVPSRSRSSDVAYEMRRNPGASKPSPAASATRASSSTYREVPGARDACGFEHLRDAREQVERPARRHALDARILREPFHQLVAARLCIRSASHRPDPASRSAPAAPLSARSMRRSTSCVPAACRRPSRHPWARESSRSAIRSSIRLRRRAAQDGAIAHAFGQHLREIVRHVVVDQLFVAQVDDDPDAALRCGIGDGRKVSPPKSPRRSGSPAS